MSRPAFTPHRTAVLASALASQNSASAFVTVWLAVDMAYIVPVPVQVVALGDDCPASRFGINTRGILFASVTFAWVFNRARQSIRIAVLMGASFNAVQPWLAQAVPNLGRTLGDIPSALYVVVALVLIVATKGQLGYRPMAEPAVEAAGAGVAAPCYSDI